MGDLHDRDRVVLMDGSQITLYKYICFIHILFIMVVNTIFSSCVFTLSSCFPPLPPIFLSVLFAFPFCLVCSFLFCLIHCLPHFFFCHNTHLSAFSFSPFCPTFPSHFLLNFLVLFLLLLYFVFLFSLYSSSYYITQITSLNTVKYSGHF